MEKAFEFLAAAAREIPGAMSVTPVGIQIVLSVAVHGQALQSSGVVTFRQMSEGVAADQNVLLDRVRQMKSDLEAAAF